jgi:hypothetical protein
VFLGMMHASQAMKEQGDGGVILVTASDRRHGGRRR